MQEQVTLKTSLMVAYLGWRWRLCFSDCGGMTRKARDDREVEAERVAEPSCMILGSAVIFTPGRKRN